MLYCTWFLRQRFRVVLYVKTKKKVDTSFKIPCWDGSRYMVAEIITPPPKNADFSGGGWQTLEYLLKLKSDWPKNFFGYSLLYLWFRKIFSGYVEISIALYWAHKYELFGKNVGFGGLKTPKMAHETKNRFFQSSRCRYTNPTTGKETTNQC